MKIAEWLEGVSKKDIVLPEFQREYVWPKEKSKQLMVSLVKNYPVGSLLIWKTDDAPELKNVDRLPDKLGTLQIILDGQQRLTTLYMLLKGDIPPFYKIGDIQYDPRDLYYNLDSGEFQYFQALKMRGDPLWRCVVDCFKDDGINIFAIAKEISSSDSEELELAKKYNDNLTNLKNVERTDIPILNVPSQASLDDAIDIFDRVNSLGTKLTDAELALTHVTGKWPQARREMKSKIAELNKTHFDFDLTFTTRALTVVVARRALFDTIHGKPKEELKSGWKGVTKILDYLISTLPQKASIHSTEDLNSNNVLIPLIVYLAVNDLKFPNDTEFKHAVHWLYAAHTWARYTAQTDQRLEHDVSLVLRERSPWRELRNQIIDQRGRIEVKPDDLEGRVAQHPLYRTTYILAKVHGAVDWFNGMPLGSTHGKAYCLHSHHIFPTSRLYKSQFDSDNHLHRKIVNEIANRAFLTADSNVKLSNDLPEVYLPEVEDNYPGALPKQFIPMDPLLWKLENYTDFLEERRKCIARKFNEFMDALIAEPEDVRERHVGELITLGESATLEFKSSLQWDVVHTRVNKDLRHSVLKTIAGFLNSQGGTLLIGVEDTGQVLGLKNDLKRLNDSKDRFEQLLMSLISDNIGADYGLSLKIRFEPYDGVEVCVIDVDKAVAPVYLTGERGKEFYVRVGNTTRPLDSEETVRFIHANWE